MILKLDQSQIESVCYPFFNDIHENKFQVYMTVGGNIAIVLNRTGGGKAPIVGVYFTGSSLENGEWIACKWSEDGTFPSINDKMRSTKLDLKIPKKENNTVA